MNPFKPLNRGLLIAGLGISLAGFGGEQAAEASIRNRVRGTVSVMGKPVADASVTLWTTRGGQEPESGESRSLQKRRKLCGVRQTKRRHRSLPGRLWWNGQQVKR